MYHMSGRVVDVGGGLKYTHTKFDGEFPVVLTSQMSEELIGT